MTQFYLTPAYPATFYYTTSTGGVVILRTISLKAGLPPSNQPCAIFAGDSVILQFTMLQSDGTPQPLDGVTVEWYMKGQRPIDTLILIHKSNGNGTSVTDATNGIFEVTLSPTDTAKYAGGTYYFYAKVTDASGNVSTVTTGTVTIT